MKKMILTLALSAVMLSAGAQITERRMATLVETDGTQVFYGANAAKEAYDVAKDGATIILSEGKFDGIDMKEKPSRFMERAWKMMKLENLYVPNCQE